MDQIFKMGVDIDNGCKSNDVLEAMFECIGIIAKHLDNESQQISLKQCIARLRKHSNNKMWLIQLHYVLHLCYH